MRKCLLAIGSWMVIVANAQVADSVYYKQIKTVKLFTTGDQLGYPAIPLGSTNSLELHFDDLDGYIKQYYYTFTLCNADWQPVTIFTAFDYITGFLQQRISTYRASSVSLTKYVHYTTTLPDRNCQPKRTGNYILRVFRDADTSKLVFTKKFLVYEDRLQIGASITQPFDPSLTQSHHKVQIVLNTQGFDVTNPAQQLRITVLQNNRWDIARSLKQPTFYRGPVNFEYNNERELAFPAGKEWRWLDLRSFRFQSDRVRSVNYGNRVPEVQVSPDAKRTDVRYLYYRDFNGMYQISTTELINPWWQSDYGWVTFTYVPSNNQPFSDRDLYLFGELTNYQTSDTSRMVYNAEKGVYEKTLFLKMGYYNYTVISKTRQPNVEPENLLTEGDWWETEDQYMVLVYYRPIGALNDELIGLQKLGSLFYRNNSLYIR
jgi:hypothetical protein